MRTAFIVNPEAGGGKAKDRWLELAARLDDIGYPYIPFLADKRGAAEMVAKKAIKNGFDRVFAVGGDGTLQEVANGIFGSSACLGMIPFGTANEFAKTMELPGDTDGLIGLIRDYPRRRIDMGIINDRVFCNIAGIGFDGEITGMAEMRYRQFGAIPAYLISAMKVLATYRPPLFQISLDGETTSGRFLLVACGNGIYYGGGMKILPQADVEDGYLDICTVKAIPVSRIFGMLPRVYGGNHINDPHVNIKRGRRVKVESDPPVKAEADGEFVCNTPVDIRIVPSSLDFIAY